MNNGMSDGTIIGNQRKNKGCQQINAPNLPTILIQKSHYHQSHPNKKTCKSTGNDDIRAIYPSGKGNM
jgi:hypothetical protein